MTYCISVTITSLLPDGRVPLDPVIDFGQAIRDAKIEARLDPNSIIVVNARSGRPAPLSEEFAHGDVGRVQWVTENPADTQFEVRFCVAEKRPPMKPAAHVPLIGTGDLLRYNAGRPMPISVSYPSRLADLTGDGRADLVGCWNYAHRAGLPWDGIFCFPRVGKQGSFEFGDPAGD